MLAVIDGAAYGVDYSKVFQIYDAEHLGLKIDDKPPYNDLIIMSNLRYDYEWSGNTFTILREFDDTYKYFSIKEAIDAIKEDIEDAVAAWNCLCDWHRGQCNNKIKAYFTDNEREMGWEKRNTLAEANVVWDMFSCDMNIRSSTLSMFVRFNNTSYFRYDDRDQTEGVEKRSFVNRRCEDALYAHGTYGSNFYSFYDVVLHEFGHLMGFMHPWSDCNKIVGSNMNQGQSPNSPSAGLSDYDKCIFVKTFCPWVSIQEIAKRYNIVISPNPTTGELNISFEIKDGIETVSIQIVSEQGQFIETLLSDAIYTEGIHNFNSKLNLPTGMYFLQLKINKTNYFEKIIIAK